jgi:hypothetical protein
MKEIYFKRLKGRINPSPRKFALLLEDECVTESNRVVTVHCTKLFEYRKLRNFVKQYIFLQIDCDDKKMEIYMPKSYILCIKTVEGSLNSEHF